MDRAEERAGPEDVGDQALMRGLDTALPFVRPGLSEAAIGRRGEITVTAENRALVRRWFVTQGLPALFVGGLSMRELALAYNDTRGEQFSRLLRKYEDAKEAAGEETAERSFETSETIKRRAEHRYPNRRRCNNGSDAGG
jgi:hypothetical protein